MIKLGQTTTGTQHGVKYLWLLKDLDLKTYTDKIYVVFAFNGNGWFRLFNGTLKECRNYIGDEEVVDI